MGVKYLLILSLLFASAFSAQTSVQKRSDIVEANHYFSEQNKQKGYSITQLQKGKPIAVVLKPVQNQQYSNPITLTIKSGSKSKECKFQSFQDLCVLEEVQKSQGQLHLKCENLPCDVSWNIYQSTAEKLESSDKVANMYRVSADSSKMMMNIYCSSAEVKKKQDKIALVFSNLNFATHSHVSNQFVAFDEVKQGYIYVVIMPQYKSCAKIKINKPPKVLENGNLVEDYLVKGKKNIYEIKDLPDKKNFVFEIGFHLISTASGPVMLSVTGQKGGDKKLLKNNKIPINPSAQSFDLSYGVSKIDLSQWKNVRLQIQSENQLIMINLMYKNTQVFEVEATEYNYFDLKKGQKLSYHLIKQQKAEETDVINITPNEKDALKISKEKCNVKPGCEFEIEALKDIQGSIYLGVGSGEAKEILILDFASDLSFTHKIKELEKIYIKKKIQKKKSYQVIINTPNVIIYASNTKKCQFPSESCFERSGNINKHFIYQNLLDQEVELIFLIKALDTCEFTLTLIGEENQLINLVDSQPFVYLFDEEEQHLKFRFVRKNKADDVSFNLIAPLQALDLIVQNGKHLPDDEEATISTQGFLQFKASQFPKNQFTVLVRKRPAFKQNYVHFTLIVATKGKFIRLQSGITHYETLTTSSRTSANYIFQFDPKQDFILNFYSHNTKQEQVKVKMVVQAEVGKESRSSATQFTIDKTSDALSLYNTSATLCSKVDDEDNCQISVYLKNEMDVQLDIAITLLSKHTILEMKDGVWQSFSLNKVAKTTHFYFLPRNKDHDIALMFKTTDPNLRMKYRLFYSADNDVDPTSWPFPTDTISTSEIQIQKMHKPVNHFSISKSLFENCWPSCIVLVSVIELQKRESSLQGFFSIMGSNSIMQIPQKEKIDITLAEQESKSYLIDLKYAMSVEQNIYFYIYHSIGISKIYASVYSQKSDRIPDEQSFDFDLSQMNQYVISLQKIKEIISEQKMQEHNNVYLYLVVLGITDVKVSLQFAFKQLDETNQKFISVDSFEHLALRPNEQRIYYTTIYQPIQLKIIRDKGFPIISTLMCHKQLSQCLEEVKDKQAKEQQILTKVSAYSPGPCDSCLYMIKLKSQKDAAELTLHLQSMSSQIQLSENKPVYDFTEKDQTNSYTFFAIRGEEIFVNIHVSEGEIDAILTDQSAIVEKKTSSNLISFVILPKNTEIKNQKKEKISAEQRKQLEKQEEKLKEVGPVIKKNPALTQALMTAFGLSDKFIQLHVSVKSTNKSKPSIYTISYSSGVREFDLQDGMITDYLLQPNKQAVFYYSSRQTYHMYFTISMEKSTYIKDLQIKIKYCVPKDQFIDDDCWQDYNSDKPTLKDKVPHPTLVYLLNNQKYFAIFLTYKGDHSQSVSLGMNHQQIMILPFEVQYPFILHKNENLDLLVEISNPGYIEIVTRKCDESNPLFSYTFDYEGFQNNQFTYQSELGSNPKSKFMSKVKPGTLYLRMKSPAEENSILSIMVRYSEKKIVDQQILPGNKGNLEYQIVDSSNAQITLKPPTCPDSKCPKFKYQIMTALKMRDLYSQLVCPYNFFVSVEFPISQSIKATEVTPKENSDGTVTLDFKLADQISYVGVKVIANKDKEIFYKPVEVATFWGNLSRTSHSHKLSIASIFVCTMVGLIIFVRRSARRGYKPIQDQI